MPITVEVAAEEEIYPVSSWDNGAGPMWCWGSSTIVRDGNQVFASVNDAEPNVNPLCNTRWYLYQRTDGAGWNQVSESDDEYEREPCPLVRTSDGEILLSTTPSVGIIGQYPDGRDTHRCKPTLLAFDIDAPSAPRTVVGPVWSKNYAFSEHSYRGMAADGLEGGLFLTQQVADDRHYHPQNYDQAWCYWNPNQVWSARGVLRFPMRGCYPTFSVDGSAVHAVAISDEVEPNKEWQEYKREVTGRDWDYEFRQLFYSWTPDITSVPFSPALTIASQDETAGQIHHRGMYIDPEGDAHVLYVERNIWHPFMRGRFFPDTPIVTELKYAKISRGRVTGRRTLVSSTEEIPDDQSTQGVRVGPVVTGAAIHATPDGRVFVLWHQTDQNDDETGLFIRQMLPEWDDFVAKIALNHPLPSFFSASQSAGCLPSNTVDLLGQVGDVIRYAQIAVS